MRKTVIAGNWKMNKTASEAAALIEDIKKNLNAEEKAEVIVCVPFTDIAAAVEHTKGSVIKVGAQNVHFAPSGAFTGEISASMLVEAGVEYVIIGHSERRQYFGETDQTVNQRLTAALAGGLKVIVCVGESLDEREDGVTSEIIVRQTKIALKGVSAEDMKKIIIAYEPVWAIGTGKTATSEQADEACGTIRAAVASLYGSEIAEATVIQYGGSMNAGNAKELLACENIDGGLIGGASLKAPDFATIIHSC
ncbi:MAG: triose-phosphate isomerase [Ruminococcaceae bacterium]|nr:triose-phosphate isomerase [Oscillospiraceae bacterium]